MAEGTNGLEPLFTKNVRYVKLRLDVVEGPSVGTSRETARKLITIGTAADNALVLDDETVARWHCEVVPLKGDIQVRDRRSASGTYLGSVRLWNATFTEKFEIRLGSSVIAITPLDEIEEREQSGSDNFGELVGQSAAMREIFADLARISRADCSVLIEAEKGTGKDLVARSIHRASPRANAAYEVLDCSKLSPTSAESELFGHERGVFAGVVSSHAGVFERAHGGTLFLDNVGHLPKDLQLKVLRALEKREIRRLGSEKAIVVDVRLIAATDGDLAAQVQRGTFRDDLYRQVAATCIDLPPLRHRQDDIELLVHHFLRISEFGVAPTDFPPPIWKILKAYSWPGNVTELKNTVHRLSVTSRLSGSSPDSLRRSNSGTQPPRLRVARREAVKEFERAYVERLLARASGNVRNGAELAGVSPQMINKLVRKHR